MIEKVVRDYLKTQLNNVPVYLEIPANPPVKYVFVQKTGSTKLNHIESSTFTFQSYDGSLYKACVLNDLVKDAIENMITLDEIGSVNRNSDYPFPDADRKEYRYQAVFEITHY